MMGFALRRERRFTPVTQPPVQVKCLSGSDEIVRETAQVIESIETIDRTVRVVIRKGGSHEGHADGRKGTPTRCNEEEDGIAGSGWRDSAYRRAGRTSAHGLN